MQLKKVCALLEYALNLCALLVRSSCALCELHSARPALRAHVPVHPLPSLLAQTAAFLLPILERLLYRPVGVAATRVLIITPTRELAAQCHAMAATLSAFCDPPLMLSLITGGTKNLRVQEAELRQCPDVVVCTPGRMIDHLANSHGVHLDELSVLVLDEVDRLLELGFKDEVEELIGHCPVNRQTLLFSATMNTTVEALAALSLKRPVRVGVDVQGHVAGRLNQEFIRIKAPDRDKAEEDRAATLAALVTRTFKERCIVFFDTKVTLRSHTAKAMPPPVRKCRMPGTHPGAAKPALCALRVVCQTAAISARALRLPLRAQPPCDFHDAPAAL